ncbi:pilus assembly protein PilM [Candidatus Uhrbacteria bacterium]|nr:pilus assembly protein PilM [Candidatus Uhrbacteria bacterium]MBT7717294.1 pilus assembly protein PilM [Candidatus Uhrbacteria bacterium]
MKFFSKKDQAGAGMMGVDIGAGGIKIVEILPQKGRAKLSTYGHAQRKTHTDGALIDQPQKAAKLISAVVKKAGMKSGRVNAALPSQAVFHAIVTIPQPKSKKDDLKPLIEAQVTKLLPRPIGEMILDSTVIDKHLLPKDESVKAKKSKDKKDDKKSEEILKAKERKHIRVLVSGAPKVLVQKYVDIFKVAKLELASLETEAFALIRSLVGKDMSKIMIVDIGYERTNITIVSHGIPFLHRSIKAGGINVTQAIAKQMGISPAQAEQVKFDLAIGAQKEQKMPNIIRESVMPILHEVKYALELYDQQDFHEHSVVDKIILTGGSAHLPFLDPFLTEALNINVYLGNPWARIATPEGSQEVLSEIGPRMAVAAGLAMKVSKNS